MTICKFYANGFCRYGNSCRFEHNLVDNRNNYYSKQYNRSDVHSNHQTVSHKHPSTQTSNRTGFSFNRTLDNIRSNPETNPFERQNPNPFGGHSNSVYGSNPTTSSARNSFQLSNNSASNPRPSGFSFNRTLQQISTTDRPSIRSNMDDIEMDSSSVPRMSANPSRESQPPIGLFSPSNHSNLFSNNSFQSTNSAIVSKVNPNIKPNDDIYSKTEDLTENDLKQFKSNMFTFKSIPICPPTQELCY